MSRRIRQIVALFLMLVVVPVGLSTLQPQQAYAAPLDGPCDTGSFLGFPTWYKYLEVEKYNDEVIGQSVCQPKLNSLNDTWRIGAAILEILLRVAALISIGFIVYAGITYTLSQGQPDKTKQALKTIISALVGLAISIAATAVVTFIAGRF